MQVMHRFSLRKAVDGLIAVAWTKANLTLLFCGREMA